MLIAMDIKIKKIKVDKLKAINSTFAVINFEPSKNREQSAERSILREVRKTMLKKEVSLGPETQSFNLTFKYHEADVLEKWLRFWLFGEEPSYETTLISSFADELNQQLA